MTKFELGQFVFIESIVGGQETAVLGRIVSFLHGKYEVSIVGVPGTIWIKEEFLCSPKVKSMAEQVVKYRLMKEYNINEPKREYKPNN